MNLLLNMTSSVNATANTTTQMNTADDEMNEVNSRNAANTEKQEYVHFIIANTVIYLVISLSLLIYVAVFLYKYYKLAKIEKANSIAQVSYVLASPPTTSAQHGMQNN
jgi:hypothetical protein